MRFNDDDLQEAAFESGMDFDPQTQLGQVFEPSSDDIPSDQQGWVQTQGEIPAEETPGSGWPAAVPIRPANWDVTTDPDSYMVAWGDTLAGLAATYLGTPMRWREIWDQQPDAYRFSHSPDDLMPGQWLFMPPDASATLRAALGQPPEPGDRPAPAPPGGYPTPVGPSAPPGQAPGGTTTTTKKKIWPWVAGGVGVAALAAYALS